MIDQPVQPVAHPRSKLLFGITIVVVLSALVGAGYYFYRARTTTKTATTDQPAATTATPATTTAPTPTSSTQSAVATELSSDIGAINTKELSDTVIQMKTAMSSFNR